MNAKDFLRLGVSLTEVLEKEKEVV